MCELIGIPLIDHLYVNTEGSAVSMRHRGILKRVPGLLLTLRESASALAVKVWEEGRCDDDYHEKKKAAAKEREAETQRAPMKITTDGNAKLAAAIRTAGQLGATALRGARG